MTSTTLQHWLFMFMLGSGLAAFITVFAVFQLQPQRMFRYFGACFGWILFCFGAVFLLGAWQNGERHGGWDWHDWRVLPGLGIWALGMCVALAFWFGDPAPKPDEQQRLADDGYRACLGHARWMGMLSLFGLLATIVAVIVALRYHGGGWLSSWWMGLVWMCSLLPAAVLSFVLVPRCRACQGKMKVTAWRPVSYRCSGCGKVQQTTISIGQSVDSDD